MLVETDGWPRGQSLQASWRRQPQARHLKIRKAEKAVQREKEDLGLG